MHNITLSFLVIVCRTGWFELMTLMLLWSSKAESSRADRCLTPSCATVKQLGALRQSWRAAHRGPVFDHCLERFLSQTCA